MALKAMEWAWAANALTAGQLVSNVRNVAVAAGWSVLDPGVTTTTGTADAWCVVTKNFSDGPFNDETAYVKIATVYSGGVYNLCLGLYSSWNVTTHTGTNEVGNSI